MDGLGWAVFFWKTMGGLGHDPSTHGLTFLGPARPIRSSSTDHKIFVWKYWIIEILWAVQYMKTGTFSATLVLHKFQLALGRAPKFEL